ncbi:NPCBM/NEW2 domain-containing protein [Streptomyces griseoaurantiacus]|uniref:NPCBM/NEW2 domain-containing protein n=1 Tax=Streptomyces griseoaurantiacus TaxID=68213 RepID=UPI0036865A18
MSVFATVFAPIFGVVGLFGVASLLYAEFGGRFSLGPISAVPPGTTLSDEDKRKFRVIGAVLLVICFVMLLGGFLLNSGGGKKEDKSEPTPDPVSSSPSVTPSETQTPDPTPTPSPSPSKSSTPTESPQQPEKISLASLTPLNENVNLQPASLNGEEYLDLVREDPVKCGKEEMTYNIGKKYSKFTATAGLYDDYNERDAPSWIFAVYANDGSGDRELFKKKMKFGDAQPINVPIKNAIRLNLVIQWVDPGYSVTCSPLNSYAAVWARPTLTP